MAAGTNYRYPDAIQFPNLMADYGTWLSQTHSQHPIEITTEIHARLVTIHPFTDGNGRVARLPMNMHLLRTSYHLAIVQAADRTAYINAVVTWQSGDTAPLLLMVANCVKASALEILSLAS